MANKTTLLVTAMPNPNELESMQAYLKGVMPLLVAAGGQLVKRVKVQGKIGAGKPSYGMAMIMDFPDRGAVEALFASKAYATILPARNKGFSSIEICLAGDL